MGIFIIMAYLICNIRGWGVDASKEVALDTPLQSDDNVLAVRGAIRALKKAIICFIYFG